jgi:hypothetical protein
LILLLIISMLRNYAHHTQSQKSSVHRVHKMQGKAIWQTLKKLSYRSSFVQPWILSHSSRTRWPIIFSRENDECSLHDRHDREDRSRSGMCTEETYRAIGARIGRIPPICARDCAWPCTCAHMHKMHLPIAPNQQHTRYFMGVISSTPMRCDFSVELFSLVHIASHSSAYCTKRSKSCA